MTLTDQERVILRAIERVGSNGIAEISKVVKAVGYPKAVTKRTITRLAEKGLVTIHRHDWPQSLRPEERKLMVRIGRDYYGAVSVRKKNPKGSQSAYDKKLAEYVRRLQAERLATNQIAERVFQRFGQIVHRVNQDEIVMRGIKGRDYIVKLRNPKSKSKTALRRTGRALKGFARGALSAGSEILGAGAMALNPVRRKVRNKYIDLVIKGQAKKTPQGWRVGKKTFAQGRGTVNVSSGYYLDRHTGMVYAKRERNMARRRKRNIEMGFYDASGFHPIRASSDYSEGQRPSRSKRAKSAKRKATATASHKRKVSSRRATTRRLASRAIKKAAKSRKRRNIQQGFYDSSGFHPIRASSDYDPGIAGETGRKPVRTRSKKKASAKRKAASTARSRARVRSRKATTSRLAGRAIKKSAGLLKGKRRNTQSAIYNIFHQPIKGNRRPRDISFIGQIEAPTAKGAVDFVTRKRGRPTKGFQYHAERAGYDTGKRINPSATSIRKKFAGSVNGSRDLFFPQGTPSGQLAKLGKLVLIETEKGTIKPVHGTAWLCADTKERLHIGSTTNAPLYSGPARSFGKVTKVEYESSKPHLGYRGPIIWFHNMGEKGGSKPTLHADGKGGLKFRGGRYALTTRGIEH